MLDLVPLGGAGREVADGDLQSGLPREIGDPGLPRPGAVAVGAAGVSGDQQPPGAGVAGPAGRVPPAADRLHRERGGVVVGAHAHPAGVGGQVIDAVRDRLARARRIREVMIAHGYRAALRPVLAPAAGVVTDLLLLLGVHADHRVGGALMIAGLPADVAELRIPVRVPGALDDPRAALEAESLPPQQLGHGIRADPVALAGQLPREPPRRFRRPPQRRHRIAQLVRLDQGQQRRDQPRIQLSRPLAAPARPRARPSGSAPASSSPAPSDTVASRTPAARATSRIPPRPSARASAPSSSRRCRSSRCGKIDSNFAASISRETSITPIPHEHGPFREATGYSPPTPRAL